MGFSVQLARCSAPSWKSGSLFGLRQGFALYVPQRLCRNNRFFLLHTWITVRYLVFPNLVAWRETAATAGILVPIDAAQCENPQGWERDPRGGTRATASRDEDEHKPYPVAEAPRSVEALLPTRRRQATPTLWPRGGAKAWRCEHRPFHPYGAGPPPYSVLRTHAQCGSQALRERVASRTVTRKEWDRRRDLRTSVATDGP